MNEKEFSEIIKDAARFKWIVENLNNHNFLRMPQYPGEAREYIDSLMEEENE